ncbi:hypothetical protein U732_124 [Clostridium argentinense CDC 2741]|uniref:Uncharacterized protein n=2 Tax=Clostridium argentinense TaxID=29341 RepID=A0A0C1UAI4_9CLOT|nr:hypothetical protein [Clostridium argentinense]KIE44565.1 hypothetical protein U732_124 [Clostridium argentinense CDC 2741]BBB39314.1 hypothetical protein [Clostridium argentinense]
MEKKNKTRRKRCNKCINFKYAYNSKKNKYGYKCEIAGRFMIYTALNYCEKFNKIKDRV